MKTLTIDEAMSLVQVNSRTTMYNREDPTAPGYDPTFPKSFLVGRRRLYFAADLHAWLEQKAGRSKDASTHSDDVVDSRSQLSDGGGQEVPSSREVAIDTGRKKRGKSTPASSQDSPLPPALIVQEPIPGVVQPKLSVDVEPALTENVEHIAHEVDEPRTSGREACLDSSRGLTVWDLIKSTKEPQLPDWLPDLMRLLQRAACSGTSLAAGVVFVTSEDLALLLNPDAEMLSMLDTIDLQSYRENGVLLTAVLYDYPAQCGRLERVARRVGLSNSTDPQFLYQQRTELLRLYGSEESKIQLAQGVIRWCQENGVWLLRPVPQREGDPELW